MGKNKPRHNPDKPQNKLGDKCSYYEEYKSGCAACEIGLGQVEICKGNPHNCIKTKYKKLAICDTKSHNNW